MSEKCIIITGEFMNKIVELIKKRSYEYVDVDVMLNRVFDQMTKYIAKISLLPNETSRKDLIEDAKSNPDLSRVLDILVYSRAFDEIDKLIDNLKNKNELFFILASKDTKYAKLNKSVIFESDVLYDDISLELLLDDKINSVNRSR